MPEADPQLLRTPLNGLHRRVGARLVDFAGWDMPVQYGAGILAEHQAVRERAGLFDVSHMGRVFLRGPDALPLAQRCCTRDLSRPQPGDAAYGLFCEEDGGIRDDVIAYLLSPDELLFVFNAANRLSDLERVVEERTRGHLDVEVADETESTAFVAIQGPLSQEILQPLCDARLDPLPGFAHVRTTVAGVGTLLSRTGYTGEDGFEMVVLADQAERLWQALSADPRVQPCGLGARDTLRTEAGLPLHGHDIDRTTNPYEAGLGWTVDLTKSDFTGRAALEALHQAPPARRLVGLLVEPGGVPRPGFPILHDGSAAGVLTSGTFAPTLKRSIALGYVAAEHAAPGTRLAVEIRGKPVGAEVTRLPFVPHRSRPRRKPAA